MLVGDFGDQVGVDAVAAIGKHRVARGHLHRRHRSGTERHGQVGRVLVSFEAEAGDPVLRVLRTNRLQNPDGHHVLGFLQGCTQAHGPVKSAVVIFGLPRLAAGHAGVKKQRRVIDDRGRREAFFKRCRIDEGLEARARLPPGLRHVVEFIFIKIKTANQGAYGAVARVHSDKSALDFRQLGDLPGRLGGLGHPDQRAASQPDVGRRLGAEP